MEEVAARPAAPAVCRVCSRSPRRPRNPPPSETKREQKVENSPAELKVTDAASMLALFRSIYD
jgi:hypothetical protein